MWDFPLRRIENDFVIFCLYIKTLCNGRERKKTVRFVCKPNKKSSKLNNPGKKLLFELNSVDEIRLVAMGLFKMCASASADLTNICEIDVINMTASTLASVLQLFGIIYIYLFVKERWMQIFFWIKNKNISAGRMQSENRIHLMIINHF